MLNIIMCFGVNINRYSLVFILLFYWYVKMKMKTGTVWSNTLFHCNVSTFPELHYCGYEMKTKRGSGVYIWSVNTVRKTAAAEASWLMISSTPLFYLQKYRTCIVPSRAGPCRDLWRGRCSTYKRCTWYTAFNVAVLLADMCIEMDASVLI